ncbi:MAG: protein kinase domain-containing protein, partial [Fimbriiglobus sp.]
MPDAPPCPHADAVRRLTAGTLPPADAVRVRSHAAGCRACGPLLGANPPPDSVDFSRLETAAELPPSGRADGLDFLAPAEAADELGRLGPYRVLDVLGAGGMGMVFRAEDTSLRRQVALKVMHPRIAAGSDARERFLREARSAAAVDHDNVVPVFQVGEDRGTPYLAMPLLRGRPLAAVLYATPRLPVAEAVRVAREVADGLAAAHTAGLVHRDIKPANIWLEDRAESSTGEPTRPRARVLDFGLARPITPPPGGATSTGSGRPDPAITAAGMVVGTPGYMSPEQASGKPLDHRTDLFSLGTVIYEMVTGTVPFRAADNIAVLGLVVNFHPTSAGKLNPAVSQELDRLISRLMAKDPSDRPATARIAAVELARIAAALDAPTTLITPTVRPSTPLPPTAIVDVAPPTPVKPRSKAKSRKSAPPPRSGVSELWWVG